VTAKPLVFHPTKSNFPTMSAVELLEKVKSLPAREREKFLWAVLALDDKPTARAKIATQRAQWPDVEARAKRTFGRRVLPNLVLWEREEAAS